jgi:lysophospholipase L1-like esterase
MHVSIKVPAAGAAVCFLILGASACATNQPASRNGKPIIDFVGDSITFQSTADINAHYSTNYDVGIEAVIGIDTYLSQGAVQNQAADAPSVEVINLGTNDANRVGIAITGTRDGQPVTIEPAQTIQDIEGRLDAFNAEFPDSCVVFVTINTHNPSWSPANAAAINDHIRATFPHVADWDAAYDPSYFDLPDQPHPNETGRQALLALEDATIARCTPAS